MNIGDRVKIYGSGAVKGKTSEHFMGNGEVGTVKEVHESGWMHVILDGNAYFNIYLHPKQCRRIRMKPFHCVNCGCTQYAIVRKGHSTKCI